MFFDDSSLDSSSDFESGILDVEEDTVILMVAKSIASSRNKRKRAGSQIGRATFRRDRIRGCNHLMQDNFVVDCAFPSYVF